MDWIDLAQERDNWLAVVKNGNGLSGSAKFGEFIGQVTNH